MSSRPILAAGQVLLFVAGALHGKVPVFFFVAGLDKDYVFCNIGTVFIT